MRRTAFTIALSLLLATPAMASSAWRFQVFLDDTAMGYHDFEIKQRGDRTTVRSSASFKLRMLMVTLYRYEHENNEVWQDGCLQSFEATTQTRGDNERTVGSAGGNGFDIEANGQPASFDVPCAMTFAYWNPSFLRQQALINPQTGELEDVVVVNLGTQRFESESGTFEAYVHELRLERGVIRVWHEQETGRWLALESDLENGRTLRYLPEALPDRLPPLSEEGRACLPITLCDA